ncbi:MAG: hypothetical protein U0804_19695 [Gemmataceae bacterium]
MGRSGMVVRLARRALAVVAVGVFLGGAAALAADLAQGVLRPCPSCRGSGQILGRCAVCNGAGTSDTGNRCQSCGGSGQRYRFCRTCNGSGVEPGAIAAPLPPSCLFGGSRCAKSGGTCNCGAGCKCP